MSGSNGLLAALNFSQGAMSFGANLQQGRWDEFRANYEAGQNEANARLARIQTEDAYRRGEELAIKQQRKSGIIQGQQRLAMGAQGIDLSTGTAAQLVDETSMLSSEDERTIKNNAWREAWGYRVNAQQYDSQASMKRHEARARRGNTLLTAGLSAIGPITDSADYLYKAVKSNKRKENPGTGGK